MLTEDDEGVELLNEPRLSSTFSMAELQDFYANGSSVVEDASGSADMNVTIHGTSRLIPFQFAIDTGRCLLWPGILDKLQPFERWCLAACLRPDD